MILTNSDVRKTYCRSYLAIICYRHMDETEPVPCRGAAIVDLQSYSRRPVVSGIPTWRARKGRFPSKAARQMLPIRELCLVRRIHLPVQVRFDTKVVYAIIGTNQTRGIKWLMSISLLVKVKLIRMLS